jgi:hypothetical protein
VTIGIGFLCDDGIVICSDNQITWTQSHKDYKRKIYQHSTADWAALFTFAGNPDLMESFDGKFRETMKIVPPPHTASKIQDAIETVLSFMDLVETDPDGLYMICGIVIPKREVRLLKTSRKIVSELQDYGYVGVGDSSILRFLGQLITQSPKGYRTRQALRLAIYLVLKAKTHIDGCGGYRRNNSPPQRKHRATERQRDLQGRTANIADRKLYSPRFNGIFRWAGFRRRFCSAS